MVVAGRIAWARRAILIGVPAQIGISCAADGGRAKLRIRLHHGLAATSPVVREVLRQQLDLIEGMVRRYVAVDRGHHHTGANVSEFSIWLDAFPNVQPPDSGDLPPDGNDGDGYSGNRPRRGRSPPTDSAADPWQNGGADPWSYSHAQGHPAKAPRQRAPAMHAWDAWRPSTSSITPDPPSFRAPRTSHWSPKRHVKQIPSEWNVAAAVFVPAAAMDEKDEKDDCTDDVPATADLAATRHLLSSVILRACSKVESRRSSAARATAALKIQLHWRAFRLERKLSQMVAAREAISTGFFDDRYDANQKIMEVRFELLAILFRLAPD